MSSVITIFGASPRFARSAVVYADESWRCDWARGRSLFCVPGYVRPFHGDDDLTLYACNANFGRVGEGTASAYGAHISRPL